MDRKLREEITAEVQKAVTAAMMAVGERWITADELCNQFQMFSKDWVEKYGDVLPRKRVKVTSASVTCAQMKNEEGLEFTVKKDYKTKSISITRTN